MKNESPSTPILHQYEEVLPHSTQIFLQYEEEFDIKQSRLTGFSVFTRNIHKILRCWYTTFRIDFS